MKQLTLVLILFTKIIQVIRKYGSDKEVIQNVHIIIIINVYQIVDLIKLLQYNMNAEMAHVERMNIKIIEYVQIHVLVDFIHYIALHKMIKQ